MERAGSKCHQVLDSAAEGRQQPLKLSSNDVFYISMAVLAVWKTLLVGAIGIHHACLTPACLTAYPSSKRVATSAYSGVMAVDDDRLARVEPSDRHSKWEMAFIDALRPLYVVILPGGRSSHASLQYSVCWSASPSLSLAVQCPVIIGSCGA